MTKSDPADYQALNQELEGILEKLQADDIDVDEVMKAYERGLKVVAELETYLKQAENKVTKLQASAGE